MTFPEMGFCFHEILLLSNLRVLYPSHISFHDEISSAYKRSFVLRGEFGRIIVIEHLTETDIIYLMEDFFLVEMKVYENSFYVVMS